MTLLNQRDRRHLKALLWRTKITLRRSKGKIFRLVAFQMIIFIIMLSLSLTVPNIDLDIYANEQVTVTTSRVPTSENDYFVNKEVKTMFNLPNCTIQGYNASQIGIIREPRFEANKVYQDTLTGIFDEIKKAYDHNNAIIEPYDKLQQINFTNYHDLVAFSQGKHYRDSQICFSYGFSEFDETNNKFDFYLYFSANKIPLTNGNQVQDEDALYAVSSNGISSFNQFNYTGFEQLMTTATSEVLKNVYKKSNINFEVAYLPMNTGAFQLNTSINIAVYMYPIVILFIANIGLRLVESITLEVHEDKILWMLQLLGFSKVTDLIYKQMITCLITVPVVSAIAIISSLVCFPSVSIFTNLFMTLLFLYNMNAIVILINYSCSEKTGQVLQIALKLFLLFVQLLQSINPVTTPFTAYLQCWIPNLQITILCKLAAIAANSDKTINLSNLNSPISDVLPNVLFIVGFSETIFFSLLILYLWPLTINPDNDKPKRFYYPILPSFWIGLCKSRDNDFVQGGESVHEQLITDPSEVRYPILTKKERDMIDEGNYEPLTGSEANSTLQIRGLRKKFGSHVAVNDLNLTLFKDQILVLLGHNGAGKTTTLNMLTSQIKATAGQAMLDEEIDLLRSYESIVDSIGVCPQEDVLLFRLTVRENLQFFGQIKGIEQMEVQINDLLEQNNMRNVQHLLSNQLSGGQKRKLQLMISMLGRQKIILLDEPSSGMDPQSRRDCWEMIHQCKQNSIVIMTTHYMDEAEALADRVAIISDGQLYCCGSSLFLKNKYREGFYIEIDRLPSATEGQLSACKQLVQSYVDKSLVEVHETNQEIILNVKEDDHGHLVFTVPETTGFYFKELFAELDERKFEFGIDKYNIRTASLEEVFVRIGKDSGKYKDFEAYQENQRRNSVFIFESTLGKRTCWKTFNSYLQYAIKSNPATCCFSLFLIPIFVLVGVLGCYSQLMLKEHTLDLNDYRLIYGSVLPLQVPANQFTVLDDTQSTDSLLGQLWSDNFVENDWTSPSSTNTDLVYRTFGEYADSLQAKDQTYYGAYLVYQMPEEKSDLSDPLSVAVYGNLQSLSAQGSFGALMMQQIARFYAQEKTLELNFYNSPIKPNIDVSVQQAPKNLTFLLTMCLYWTIIQAALISFWMASRFENKFYDTLMMKSGAPLTYFFTKYLIDLFLHLWGLSCLLLISALFGFHFEGVWLAGLLWILSNPLFLGCLVYYFVRTKGHSFSSVMAVYNMMQILSILFLTFTLNVYSTSLMWHKLVLGGSLLFAWMPTTNLLMALVSSTQVGNIAVLHGDSFANQDPLSSYGTEFQSLWLFVFFVVYTVFMLLLLCDFCTPKPPKSCALPLAPSFEEKNVAAERVKVSEKIRVMKDRRGPVLKALNLVKIYENQKVGTQNKSNDRQMVVPEDSEVTEIEKQNRAFQGSMAVKGISFSLHKGEIFALLGVNGAGKSSTFNMLMGDESISGGQVIIDDLPLQQIYRKPHYLNQILGYCRQTDSLDSMMTVRATLELICHLVGVKDERVNRVVGEYLIKFNLKEFTNTRAKNLSGGNKRKLNLAIAMMGHPQVILIDEASAGVDPAARKILWHGIQEESKDSAVVITTHTMEEAEALATRIGIMASGRLKCLGSLASIQEDYGEGYDVEFNLDFDFFQTLLSSMPIKEDELELSDEQLIQEYLQSWQTTLAEERRVVLEFGDEFSRAGLLHEYWQIRSTGPIRMHSMQHDIIIHNSIAIIVQELSQQVSETSLVQFDGSYVHLRISPHKYSCGFVFGVMEDLKTRHPIREYSCKQSTLEMIFNAFAKEDQFRQINKRLSNAQGSFAASLGR